MVSCALFCHHLTDNELDIYLDWCKKNSNIGFYINDLERNWLAKYLIHWLTFMFSKSYLVKNDAPLSVLRGFTKEEWKCALSPKFENFVIIWKWAFRHLIIVKN